MVKTSRWVAKARTHIVSCVSKGKRCHWQIPDLLKIVPLVAYLLVTCFGSPAYLNHCISFIGSLFRLISSRVDNHRDIEFVRHDDGL